MPAIITGAVLVVLVMTGFGLYLSVYRDRWENQNRDNLLSLNTDAEALVYKGALEQAKTKYDELFRFLGDHKVRDTALQDELNAARISSAKVTSDLAAKKMASTPASPSQAGATSNASMANTEIIRLGSITALVQGNGRSSDGLHAALVTKENSKSWVMVDGQPGP